MTVCIAKIRMENLWNEEAFHSLFKGFRPNGRACRELCREKNRSGWEAANDILAGGEIVCHTISMKRCVKTLKSRIPEEELIARFGPDLIKNPKAYKSMVVSLYPVNEDEVTVISPRRYDDNLAFFLSALFPDRHIECSWSADGMGMGGSFVVFNGKAEDEIAHDYWSEWQNEEVG